MWASVHDGRFPASDLILDSESLTLGQLTTDEGRATSAHELLVNNT